MPPSFLTSTRACEIGNRGTPGTGTALWQDAGDSRPRLSFHLRGTARVSGFTFEVSCGWFLHSVKP